MTWTAKLANGERFTFATTDDDADVAWDVATLYRDEHFYNQPFGASDITSVEPVL